MSELNEKRVAAFDAAVAAELPRVSHIKYDSHEICKHFAGKVRERLLAAVSAEQAAPACGNTPYDEGPFTPAGEQALPPLPERIADWQPGSWFHPRSVDEMQAFFLSRLPAIREAAREHGYAIGTHGSQRRDFDLIAAPWREGASDPETLAHAVAMASSGITRNGPYRWEQKPSGRAAVTIPLCWTERHNVPSDGCIDLSVMPVAISQQPTAQPLPVRDKREAPAAVAFSDKVVSTFLSLNGPAPDGVMDSLRLAVAHEFAALGKQPAPEAQQAEPFAYVHKRGTDDEEFIHATAVNAHCPDCEPLFLDAAQQPAQAVPLTIPAICDLVGEADLDWQKGWPADPCEVNRFLRLGRLVERACAEQWGVKLAGGGEGANG